MSPFLVMRGIVLLFPHFYKGGHRLVQVLPGMGGGELDPNAGFALGHHRVGKADDVYPFL